MSKVSERGILHVAGWEGFRSCPYRDAVGVWTIGYGETQNIGPNTPCVSKPDARRQLERRINRDYLPAVTKGVRWPLKQREKDALASFTYNVGAGAFGSSTLRRKLNKRRCRFYSFRKRAYRQELPRWTNNGLLGLVRRRHSEVRIACHGDYSGRP